MANLLLKGLARPANFLSKSNNLSTAWYSQKNHNSSTSSHLTSNVPDFKNVILNEYFFKQFSTKSEKSDLETKYNEITKAASSNAYNIYVNQNRKAFAEKNPGLTMINLTKEMAKSWRELALDEKMKYFEKAKENKKEKQASLEKLFANIKIEEAKAFREEIKKKRVERRKELNNFRIRRLKCPKPPANSFFLYVKTLDRGDASIADFIRGAALKWNALALQDKEVFIKEAKANQDEYKVKLKEWETKMISEGHEKLVRKSFSNSIRKTLGKDKDKMVKANKKRAEKIKKKFNASKEKAKKLIQKAKAEKKEALKARSFLITKTKKAKVRVDKVLNKIKSELIMRKERPKRKLANSQEKAKSTNKTSPRDSADSSSSSSESDTEKPKTSTNSDKS